MMCDLFEDLASLAAVIAMIATAVLAAGVM